MEARSNLYLMCFQYNYGAECIYKTVLTLDFLWGLISIF